MANREGWLTHLTHRPGAKLVEHNRNAGTGLMTFTFELFHDNLSYPSQRNAPSSTW